MLYWQNCRKYLNLSKRKFVMKVCREKLLITWFLQNIQFLHSFWIKKFFFEWKLFKLKKKAEIHLAAEVIMFHF